MILYFILYFLLLIGAYVSKRSPFVLYLMFLSMSLLIGFRGESVGADTLTYQLIYEDLGRNGYDGYPEPIYGLLCEWGYTIGISFQIFQTLLTFSALCCTGIVIRRHSPNYCFSLFLLISLYFLFYTMNIYREMIACFISVFACYILFEEKYKRKKLKFVSLILLAAGIHAAALVLLFLLLVRRFQYNERFIVSCILLSLLIGIIDLSNIIAPLIGGYEGHLESFSREGGRLVLGLFLGFYWILAFYYLYKHSNKSFRESVYMKMFFCGIVLSNLFIRNDMGIRLMLYFSIPLIVGLPRFVKESNNSLLNQAVVVGYSSLYFLALILTNSAGVVPYDID